MTEWSEILGRLIGLAFFLACVYIEPKLTAWLSAKTGNEKLAILRTTIAEYVRAADQMFKTDDPTGEVRNDYVKEQLVSIGIEITDAIDAYIESAVLQLKK